MKTSKKSNCRPSTLSERVICLFALLQRASHAQGHRERKSQAEGNSDTLTAAPRLPEGGSTALNAGNAALTPLLRAHTFRQQCRLVQLIFLHQEKKETVLQRTLGLRRSSWQEEGNVPFHASSQGPSVHISTEMEMFRACTF